MKEIDIENLDTAITLGDAVCDELGICCDKRGRVIFQVYKRLEELKLNKDIPITQQPSEAKAE